MARQLLPGASVTLLVQLYAAMSTFVLSTSRRIVPGYFDISEKPCASAFRFRSATRQSSCVLDNCSLGSCTLAARWISLHHSRIVTFNDKTSFNIWEAYSVALEQILLV